MLFNPIPKLIPPAAFVAAGVLRFADARDPLNVVLAAHSVMVGAALMFRKSASKEASLAEQVAVWGFALLPMFFVQINDAAPVWTEVLAIVGVMITIWSLIALRHSFAIAPADRGLVTAGPYRLVRHPMYAGQMLSLFAILLGGANLLSWAVVLVSSAAAIWRILREERMIEGYSDYAAAVRWRLIPGVF